MSIRKRMGVLGTGMAVMLIASAWPLVAQETAPKAGKSAAKKPGGSARRVPTYFGDIGLSDDQKQSIYKIQASHQEKIDSLKKELAASQEKLMKECEGVLTDSQKQLLETRRTAAAEAKKSGKAAKAEPKATAEAAKDQPKPAN